MEKDHGKKKTLLIILQCYKNKTKNTVSVTKYIDKIHRMKYTLD